jgi:hypothetical protein
LSCLTDGRRQQAKRYNLATILLFCILGFLPPRRAKWISGFSDRAGMPI